MPNTRQDLISSLVERKLYPKKKKTIGSILPDGSAIMKATIPLVNPNVQPAQKQLPVKQPVQPLPVQPPITQMKLPTIPLQKILFLKRTIGI